MTRRFVNPQKIGLLEHRRNVLDYKETTWEISLCEQASILMVFLYFPLQEKRLIPTILNTICPAKHNAKHRQRVCLARVGNVC